MNCYCILVMTGKENSFKEKAQELLDSGELGFSGKLYVFRKLMRLKNAGKIYDEILFPGYVFVECDTDDKTLLGKLKTVEGYIRYLPTLASASCLHGNDLGMIQELIAGGSVQRFLRASFDENDKIVISSKYFNNVKGVVKDVNRRNHRLNMKVQLLNGFTLVNFSYFDVKKEDWSEDEENYLKAKGF